MSPITPLPAPTALAEISAYSRRQAMDWSLALASQGIEAIIERSPERERWLLLVPPSDHERALETIRLYRAENRGWSWRQDLPGVDLDLHWGAIVFCVALALVHAFVAYQAPDIEARGIMDNVKVHQHQWWRIFTAIFLHSDLGHLMSNITFGMIVLGLAMGRFGSGLALLASFFAGALGNYAGFRLYSASHQGLGASGMMMGALGLIAVHSVYLWRANPRATRVVFTSVGAGLFLFVLFGTNTQSDVLAHFGGFIGGLVLGTILALLPAKWLRRRWVDRLALFFFVTFSAGVWILALR